jgi:hypothetical protein
MTRYFLLHAEDADGDLCTLVFPARKECFLQDFDPELNA